MGFFNDLFHKNAMQAPEYDPETQYPVILCSICTGEQTAGFRDKKTGHFTSIMLIRNQKDFDEFVRICGTDEIKKEY